MCSSVSKLNALQSEVNSRVKPKIMSEPKTDAQYEVYVKAHSLKDGVQEDYHGQLGGCPFSFRALLLLEEHNVPYKIKFINLSDKPKWLLEINKDGTVPVLKDINSGEYIVGSDAISDYLEEKFEGKRYLGKVADVTIPAPDLMPFFFQYLKSGSDEAKNKLMMELKTVEDIVSDVHPFLGGKDVSAADLALAPRLYIVKVGCKGLLNWDLGDEFVQVKSYLQRMQGRKSWRNVASWNDESIVEELKQKIEN